jgi:hypothetical protein
VSGIHWCYTPGWKPDTKDGWNMEDFSIVDNTVPLRANYTPRPYPRIISGAPVSFILDDDGFTLSWNNTIDGVATEVFLPVDYENDKILLHDLGSATGDCSIASQTLSCTVNGAGVMQVSLSRL